MLVHRAKILSQRLGNTLVALLGAPLARPEYDFYGPTPIRRNALCMCVQQRNLGNQAQSKGKRSSKNPVKNADIQESEMRVVYDDPESGESKWRILKKQDALDFAQEMELDLILVNNNIQPAVCKLGDFGKLIMDQRQKSKVRKTAMKSRSLKEMYIKGGIDLNDLNIKLKKVKAFLVDGHPVKVAISSNRGIMSRNPYAIDETTLVVIEMLEDYVTTVQQPSSTNRYRKDFLLNPLSGKELANLRHTLGLPSVVGKTTKDTSSRDRQDRRLKKQQEREQRAENSDGEDDDNSSSSSDSSDSDSSPWSDSDEEAKKEEDNAPSGVRSRDKKGRFIGDDRDTPDWNEKWKDGKRLKPKGKT